VKQAEVDETKVGSGSRVKRRVSSLTWGAFQKMKNLLARIGMKRIPGADSVYVFLKRNLRPPGTVLIESHGNKMYADAKDEGVLPLLQSGGIYEEYETELFKGLLEPGKVVVDIGANIGHYTLIAARIVGDSGHVYAFEPDPHNYDLLVKNVGLNGFNNVTAVNMALSNEKGSLTLFLDKYNLGAHSLSADNVLMSAGAVEVETATLDSFLAEEAGREKVDILKVDTQGAEGLILEGAQKLLDEDDLIMLMELWPFGLRNAGYDPATLIINLDKLGFSFMVIDKSSEEAKAMTSADIIEMCAVMKRSDEHVDLFLRKIQG
jgi:FkbM family methyltransferase